MFIVCYSINRDYFVEINVAYNKVYASLIGFTVFNEAIWTTRILILPVLNCEWFQVLREAILTDLNAFTWTEREGKEPTYPPNNFDQGFGKTERESLESGNPLSQGSEPVLK